MLFTGKGNVELGAQWIRGGEGNALWKFAMDSGLFNEDECFHTGEGCGVYYTDQSVEVDPTLVEDVRKVITTADRQCSKFVECQFDIQSLSCAGDFKLSSVGDVFHQAFVQHMDNCGDSFGISKIKESLYQWHVLYTCLDNACDSLHQLSALTWGEYKDTDDKYWLNIPAGFKTVTDAIYSRLPDEAVQMNKKVLTIDWGGDSSIDDSRESHHHQTEKSARKRKYFQACITCEGGSKYYANHVIVTVSLGVLKKCHKEMFTPTLPPKKCQIIQNMGYGTLNKIFLIFNEPFWDCTTQGFQFVWTEKHINREWDNLSDVRLNFYYNVF